MKAECLAEAIRVESLGPVTARLIFGVRGGVLPSKRAELITPLCPTCHGERAPLARYCPPCAEKARQESRDKDNARKRANRQVAA